MCVYFYKIGKFPQSLSIITTTIIIIVIMDPTTITTTAAIIIIISDSENFGSLKLCCSTAYILTQLCHILAVVLGPTSF